MSDTYINDADLEAAELARAAEELDVDTCRACGEVDAAITQYVSPLGARVRVEVYECICGHPAVFISGQRVS